MKQFVAYIPTDRRHAIVAGQALPDRTQGAALFADISGFTPLTGALAAELGRKRGAEEVLRHINPVYDAIIAKLHYYGGSVIFFAGDAITCWFDDMPITATPLDAPPASATARAVACALEMQVVMAQFAEIITAQGTTIPLGIKVAVTAGPARRFQIGNPNIQLMDALAGSTLARMAAAEHMAEKGDVVVGAEVVTLLGEQISVAEWRTDDEDSPRKYAVVQALTHPVPAMLWPEIPADSWPLDAIRPWILPPIYDRLQAGATFLAELRPAVPLFLSFKGIDYDNDDQAGDKLDAYIRWVQGVVGRYEGTVMQVIIGDKGSYLYAAFGAPIAHNDDTERAVAAALELQSPPAELAFVGQVQIGVSQGQVWTGAYGAEVRNTYGTMGNQVNMAARLMGHAKPGQVLVHYRVASSAVKTFEFADLGEILVKGRVEPLPVAEALSHRVVEQQQLAMFEMPVVGREAIFAELWQALALSAQGQGQVVRLQGDKGMGKSHLATIFAQQVQQQGWRVLLSSCQSTTVDSLYYPWQQLFLRLLNLPERPLANQTQDAFIKVQIAELKESIKKMNPDWTIRLPLLGDLLGLPIPDNATTARFDPRLRQEALQALVVDILQTHSYQQPLFILIDDLHWMDEASLSLVLAVGRAISSYPILFLLGHRPPEQSHQPQLPQLLNLSYVRLLILGEISDAAVNFMLRQQLKGEISPLAVAIIQAKAHGNPFFVEELTDNLKEDNHLLYEESAARWQLSPDIFHALQEGNCLAQQDEEWVLISETALTAVKLDIPDTVHGAVLARIDRLPEEHKLVLKVASVIGRVFDLSLVCTAYPSHISLKKLRHQLQFMEGGGFVFPHSDSEYIFRHNTTYEVTYETLLFAQRQELHKQVALQYESRYGNVPMTQLDLESPLARHYPLLVHHWGYAEDRSKERVYAGLSGKQAATNYANEEAIHYFSRALTLTPAEDALSRYDLLLAQEGVFDQKGARENQKANLDALTELSQALNSFERQAAVSLRLAHYYFYTGEYDPALHATKEALAFAETAEEPQVTTEAHHLWGRLLRVQRDYPAAQKQVAHALELARKYQHPKVEGGSLLDLGNLNFYMGNFSKAIERFQESIEIYQRINERKEEAAGLMMLGVVYVNTGEYIRGREFFQDSLRTFRQIGSRRGETFCLGNLGTSYSLVGDYEEARKMQEQSLIISREIGDTEGEGFGFSNLADLHCGLGNYEEAQSYCERALAVHDALGDSRSEGYTRTYLGHALEGLGQPFAAMNAYQKAADLRRELGEEGAVIDDLAGLARVAALMDENEKALAYVDEILAWLTENSTDAVEYPLQVYLTCYRILRDGAVDEAGRTRASDVLKTAHTTLQEQAEGIKDVILRKQFLQNISFNADIVRLWTEQSASENAT